MQKKSLRAAESTTQVQAHVPFPFTSKVIIASLETWVTQELFSIVSLASKSSLSNFLTTTNQLDLTKEKELNDQEEKSTVLLMKVSR